MNNRLKNARGVAGFNTIIPTPRKTTTPPGIAPGIQGWHQLGLFSQATPDAPLRVEGYGPTPGPWWACIDTSTGRSFGGRYSAREIDYIAAKFKDWPHEAIDPGTFELVAGNAIDACRVQGKGVAA